MAAPPVCAWRQWHLGCVTHQNVARAAALPTKHLDSQTLGVRVTPVVTAAARRAAAVYQHKDLRLSAAGPACWLPPAAAWLPPPSRFRDQTSREHEGWFAGRRSVPAASSLLGCEAAGCGGHRRGRGRACTPRELHAREDQRHRATSTTATRSRTPVRHRIRARKTQSRRFVATRTLCAALSTQLSLAAAAAADVDSTGGSLRYAWRGRCGGRTRHRAG